MSVNRPKRVAVILTAIPVEFEAVRAHLHEPEEVTHPQGTVYEVGSFGTAGDAWTVVVVETGAGNDAAALEAERAIQYFGATYALFVGIAGGIKDVALGDVVAATKVYGYESGKAASEFLPRPDVGESSYDLLQRAKTVARRGNWAPATAPSDRTAGPRAYIGSIAAGSKVVASRESETAAFLRQQYGDALAVEMEGRGFLRAGHATPGLRTLVVRGISDLLGKKAESDAAGWQEIAARNAAAFAFAVLAGLTGTLSITGTKTDTRRQAPPRTDMAEPERGAPVAGMSASGPDRDELTNQGTRLVRLLSQLYPTGPADRHVWERAGGDLSTLDLRGDGRAAWYGAIRRTRLGGEPSLSALLGVVLEDFPINSEVRLLAADAVASGNSGQVSEIRASNTERRGTPPPPTTELDRPATDPTSRLVARQRLIVAHNHIPSLLEGPNEFTASYAAWTASVKRALRLGFGEGHVFVTEFDDLTMIYGAEGVTNRGDPDNSWSGTVRKTPHEVLRAATPLVEDAAALLGSSPVGGGEHAPNFSSQPTLDRAKRESQTAGFAGVPSRPDVARASGDPNLEDRAVALEPRKLTIFISYAHQDEALKVELEQRLKAINRSYPIEYWSDRQILAGAPVHDEILMRLKAADMTLLLISPAFVASDYCWTREMEVALEQYQREGRVPVPIIVRRTPAWHESKIGRHLALPKDGRPLLSWPNADEFWGEVEEGLRRLIQEQFGHPG